MPSTPVKPPRLSHLISALLTVSALVTFSTASSLSAQSEEPATPASPPYQAQRFDTGNIKIDGLLDEAAWDHATVIDQFWEFTPGENVPPPVATQILLTFDDNNLYVGARSFDPDPGAIRAHLMDRDAIDTLIQDDYILIMLDTFNDHRQAFQFRINPLGVQADALNGYVTGIEDWSWDMLWESSGRITEEGYVVEVRLPFNQLPFPEAKRPSNSSIEDDPGKTGIWRIRLGRSWPRDQRHRWSSGPVDFADACGTCSFNEFSGFVDLKPGRALKVVPTLTAGRADRRQGQSGGLQNGDEEADFGLSGQWNLNQSTRLSFAVNPDFSQVEADAAQFTVNERFALFFPEQRPFFLEGVDIFNTPLRAVFTRTVADPAWGIKLTAKEGNNTLGVFASQDNINNIILPTNQGSRFASSKDNLLEGDVLGSVVRYRRDIGQRSSVGVLYAGREAGQYANRVLGIDGSLKLADSDTLSFQVLHSETDYPEKLQNAFDLDEQTLGGEAFSLGYHHGTRHWRWNASFSRFDEDFRADSGFIPRVDVQSLGANLNRTFFPKESFLTRWSVGANSSRSEDTDGRLTDNKIGITATANGPKQSLLFGQLMVTEKRDGPLLFENLTGAHLFFEAQPNGRVRLELFAALGDDVDFANHREAELVQFSPKIEYKFGQHVQTSLDFARRSFSTENGTYLRADITEFRFHYHFNTRSFLRAIVQRSNRKNDPSQFIFPIGEEAEGLFSQLLFSYKLNAQTVLFAGYSDSRTGNEMVSLQQTERSVFFKVGYAFVL